MAPNINSYVHVRLHHVEVAHTSFSLFTSHNVGGHGEAVAAQLLTFKKGRRIKGRGDNGLLVDYNNMPILVDYDNNY